MSFPSCNNNLLSVSPLASPRTLRHPPRGVLFVDIRQAENLPPGDWLTGDTSAYAVVRQLHSHHRHLRLQAASIFNLSWLQMLRLLCLLSATLPANAKGLSQHLAQSVAAPWSDCGTHAPIVNIGGLWPITLKQL